MIYVLVHSPVTGPATWEEVAGELRSLGREAIVPDVGPGSRPYWSGWARAVADSLPEEARSGPVCFVGHSAAGLMLPLIERLLPEGAVSRSVYADASLPAEPGRSLADVVSAAFGVPASAILEQADDRGDLPPWGHDWPDEAWHALIPDEPRRRRFRAQLHPTPVELYEEIIPSTPGTVGHSAYLLFSEPYRPMALRAQAAGWPVHELRGQHLHMLVEPERVAAEIVSLAERVGR